MSNKGVNLIFIPLVVLAVMAAGVLVAGVFVVNIKEPEPKQNEVEQEDIGATIRTLPMFKASSTPYLTIEPRNSNRGLYLYENATTTKDMYANAFHGDGSGLTGTSNWLVNADGWLTTTTTIPVLLPSNATTTGSHYIGGDLTVVGDTTLVDITQQNTTVNGTLGVTGQTTLATVTGNVGIGTDSPAAVKLHVVGKVRIDAPYASQPALTMFGSNDIQNVDIGSISNDDAALRLADDEGNWQILLQADSDSYINSGNVGIGTTGPIEELDVVGTVSIRGGNVTSYIYDSGFRFIPLTSSQNSNRHWQFDQSLGNLSIQAFAHNGAVSDKKLFLAPNGGNVGIGTTDPVAKLEISNTDPSTINPLVKLNYGAGLGAGGYMSFGQVGWELGRIENVVDAIGQASLRFYDYNTALEEVMRISRGNVGIGTTNPGYALEVTGDTYLSATTTLGDDLQVNSRIITVSNGGNTHHVSPGGDLSSFVVIDKNNTGSDASLLLADQGDLKWEIGMAGDNNLYWKKVTGSAEDYTFENLFKMDYDTARIGIGTEAPGAKFEIASSSPTARVEMIISNKSTTGTDGTALRLAAETDGDAWYIGSDAGLNGGDNFFINDGTFGEGIFIDASNNVGIHDTSLTYPFEVTGDSYFTGNATTTGAGYFGGDLRVVGTLDSSDIRFDNGFILTEGDKVGLDKNELILLNEKGDVVFRFLSDGTLIAKNGIKQEPVKQNYWYLLGLLGLLGLAFKRK